MDSHTIIAVVQTLLLFIVSLTVHEYAHAWVATKLGDPTPEEQGRLTLAPHVHIDPFGTLLIPIIGTVTGFPFIGWAKPVQFSPARFRRDISMWTGTALTAMAGPLSNLVLAVVVTLVMRILQEFHLPPRATEILTVVLPQLMLLNVFLFLFNLLPLPPLDGGYLIPRRFENVREFLARYSFLIFVVMMFTGFFRSVLGPPTLFIEHALASVIGLSNDWLVFIG